MKTIVVFASNTGNTAAMAEAICEGARAAGADVTMENAADVGKDAVLAADCIAFGSPSMGVEVLDDVMEELFASLESSLSGKKVALFGSYDWGDGQWMRDWEDRVKATGATLVNGQGVIAQLTPDSTALEECRALGAQLA